MTGNNQDSFHLLTLFEHHVTSAHPHCFRDILVRDMCCKRQEWWPMSCCPSQMTGMEISTQGTIFHNKKTDRARTACCPGTFLWVQSVVQWDRVGSMGMINKELMNSSVLQWCSSLSLIFYDACGCVIWDTLMYLHWTKNRPMSHWNLRLPPWHKSGKICISFKLEKHTWRQSVRTINYIVFIFNSAHHTWRLFSKDCSFAESRSTCDFVLYSR
jgi:hypothetical protein